MSSEQQTFEGRKLDRPHEDIEDQGLAFDIRTLLSRRKMLAGLGIGVGSAALVACGVKGEGASASATSTSASATSTTAAANDLSGQTLEEMAGRPPDLTRVTAPTAQTCWKKPELNGVT